MNEETKKNVNEEALGSNKAGQGKWASCFRVFDPVSQKTLAIKEIENNEAAISCYITSFQSYQAQRDPQDPVQLFLLVGTVKDFIPGVGKMSAAFIYVYKLSNENHGV